MGARASVRAFVVISLKIALFSSCTWLLARSAVRHVDDGGWTTVGALGYGVVALITLGYLVLHLGALVLLFRGDFDD